MYTKNANFKKNRLLEDLKNPIDEIRIGAARELGEFYNDEVQAALVELFKDKNRAIREVSIESFLKIATSYGIKLLIPLLRSEDVFLRNLAIELLGKKGSEILEDIIILLKDNDEDIRKFAIDILGNIGDPEILKFVVPLLKDSNCNVRQSAAETMAKLKNPDAVIYLVNSLTLDPANKYTYIESIGKLKDVRAIPRLKDAIREEDLVINLAAIEALSEIGEKDVVPFLLERIKVTLVEGKDENQINSTLVDALVRGMLKLIDKDSESAQILSDPRLLSFFMDIAKDESENKDVRLSAMEYLGDDGDIFLSKVFHEILDNGKDVVDSLIEILDKGSTPLKKKVVKIVGDICNRNSEELLLWALHDGEKEVRELAEENLKKSESLKML